MLENLHFFASLRLSARSCASVIFLMRATLSFVHTTRFGVAIIGRYFGTSPVPSGKDASRSACANAAGAGARSVRPRTMASAPRSRDGVCFMVDPLPISKAALFVPHVRL
jgi:hypothetical protein